ncbi:MAG: DEAD/DEAH box helicase [Rhodoglobus sp.]
MSGTRLRDEQQQILRFWWMLELFSPQKVPKNTPRATRAADRQVVEWKAGEPLPWETLRTPAPLGTTRRVWQHTVYLGVYNLEATYERLRRVFGEDKDAYDERQAGRSACAGVLVDRNGRLVADSAVLSSALWAVGRIEKTGVRDRAWADGFPDAAQAFCEALDKFEGARRETMDADEPLAQDGESIIAVLRTAQKMAGVLGNLDLATESIVIESVAISAQRAGGAGDIDFLNSFFLEDLATVRAATATGRGCGKALAEYLTSDKAVDEHGRVDVIRTSEAVDDSVKPGRLPKGRWPADPDHGLSLRQQFAVNHALSDLASTHGLMGVNGPPGTGKTTMLRDILAGNVVERARQLAALARPAEAFTSTTHRWTALDGRSRAVRQLQPQLTGYEMVVVSANNAAVENVTREVPARDAIHRQWHGRADYFADLATEVLNEAEARQGGEPKIEAWGLIAARLGNKRNRNDFYSAFWFDKKDPHTKEPVPDSVPRMQTRLARWSDGSVQRKSWKEACGDFTRAEQRVDALLMERKQAQKRMQQLPQLIEDEGSCTHAVARIQRDIPGVEERLVVLRDTTDQRRSELAIAVAARDRHVGVKPGILETVLTFGRAIREWRGALKPFDDRLVTAESAQQQAEVGATRWGDRLARLQDDLRSAEIARAHAAEALGNLRHQIEVDMGKLGSNYPGAAWIGEARELHAPWLDADLDTARSELFLAALQLHQDFLANTAADMSHGLRAALEIVAGGGPRKLEAEKRRAAWQLFFLVVPLVSTTFASFGRMFGDVGPETIGWLLVDEAGQASPQYAVGAIWRAQRVVAVGDPLQLQPVVTIPQKAQRDIASAYSVSGTWIPPQASVQTLADRVSRHGTTLHQGESNVWVSAPLTVHRRCDDPMFTLCNDIAYNGIMVNGVKRRLDDQDHPDLFEGPTGPLIIPSRWIDEPALTRGSHLQENQIARLEKALSYLTDRGIPLKEVIAISPFRTVADRLGTLSRAYPDLAAGTIHTAQGKEASVVFLVLGGDPASPGAKAWAASTVNLVNVATSRAKRRLFVIGDREAWARHNYFHQLAESLPR